MKKKWLNSSEALDQVVVVIRETFQRYRQLDGPPYHLLVSELHRRVLVEYLRATMRGRLTCTSLKMRRRVAARLREDGQQIAELFKDLVSQPISPPTHWPPIGQSVIHLLSWTRPLRNLPLAGWTTLYSTSQRWSSWRTSRRCRWRWPS